MPNYCHSRKYFVAGARVLHNRLFFSSFLVMQWKNALNLNEPRNYETLEIVVQVTMWSEMWLKTCNRKKWDNFWQKLWTDNMGRQRAERTWDLGQCRNYRCKIRRKILQQISSQKRLCFLQKLNWNEEVGFFYHRQTFVETVHQTLLIKIFKGRIKWKKSLTDAKSFEQFRSIYFLHWFSLSKESLHK